jgi:DUF4097 and DUF4098 domain-containing protein YvlB
VVNVTARRIFLAAWLAAVILPALPGQVWAQVRIDKNRPARPDGEVSIENTFGSVKVIGWDRNEVAVKGVLAAGAERLEMSSDKESVWIEVDTPESWLYDSDDDSEYRSHLEVNVPMGSSVGVESLNATVTIQNVNGIIEVESVNGSVTISGNPPAVEVETTTGAIEISAEAAEMEVDTVSGAVVLKGARGRVDVETVSGIVSISGSNLQEVEIETTAGDVTFDGNFVHGEGSFEVETFSGHVEMILPHDVAARFHLDTFNGQIENEIGPRPRRDGRFNPYQEVRFTTGLIDYEVAVTTYSGNIKLRVGGGSPGGS